MVGATANVTADIIAREVVVCGKVNGNVHAKGKIEIEKDGSVIGDLTTARIIIEDGAYFKGSIEIDRSADKEADNNVSSRNGVYTDYTGGSADREFAPLSSCLLAPVFLNPISIYLADEHDEDNK
jgi:cytoskeletal protein CcmA (bactofilin family)